MKLLMLSLVLIALHVNAQQYPVTGITISLPANPDASIANWKGGASMLTISAMAKLVNGRPDVRLEDSKILVIIKKSGSKACGTFTGTSAPGANFTTVNKVWSGNNAVALLGQDCTLPPGDYELCVQLFGNGPRGPEPISEEKSRAFSIKGNEQQHYQAPQLLLPVDGAVINEGDRMKPITFRWTPVIPKPVDPVTYRLKVWQLMEGQNATQAIIQPPILGNDVGQVTQAVIVQLRQPPPNRNAREVYVWNVQALNRDGKPIGENNGTSRTFTITVNPVNDAPVAIKLQSPSNNSRYSAGEKIRFSWSSNNTKEDVHYTLKIKEILLDQSPSDALHTNKPHFEKDSLKELSFMPPSIFTAGKRYAWSVEAKDERGVKITESEINEFIISANKPSAILTLVTPANNAIIDPGPKFSWRVTPADYDGDGYYKIKIVEIKGDQSPGDALRTNKPFFEKDSLKELSFRYPSSAAKLQQGKRYAWNIQSCEECTDEPNHPGETRQTSETYVFSVASKDGSQKELKLMAPVNGAILNNNPTFSWGGPYDVDGDGYYKIKIGEITGDESPGNALRGNKPFFEKDSIEYFRGNKPIFEKDSLNRITRFPYPSSAPKLKPGKTYSWQVQAFNRDGKPLGENNGMSGTFLFTIPKVPKEGN